MPRYLVLNPNILKSAIIATIDQESEVAAIQGVPSSISLPQIVVVVDEQAIAGLPRFIVNDDTDRLLSGSVPVVDRAERSQRQQRSV
jgi:hypothetical protein